MEPKYSPIKRFLGLLTSEKTAIKKIYLYAILNGLVALSLPLGIQAIISFIQLGSVTSSWLVLVLIVIGGILVSGWLQILQLKTSENIQQRIFSKSALELAFRIPAIKSTSLYRYYAPELANRFFDTLTIQKGLSKILIDFTAAVMQIIFGLILLSIYHPFFIFLGILISLMLAAIIYFTFHRGLTTSIEESEYKYQTAHWLEEIARSLTTFKMLGKNLFHLDKADSFINKYLFFRKKHFSVLLKQYWSMVIFKAILALSLLLIGGFLVINQNMNIGQFVAAEIVILLILASVEKFILSTETLYDVLTAFDKIGKITDLSLESSNELCDPLENDPKGLKIKATDIYFSYPDSDFKILQDINFEIQAGQKICISGKNATGKASLLNLISTLYIPTRGTLQFNDLHLNDMCINDLRSHINLYIQNEKLFEGSILENITLGRLNIDKKDVREALEITCLTDFVNHQENGLHTHIMTEGKSLSKSIIQKLLLTRSILNKPKLILIDQNISAINAFEQDTIFKRILNKEFQSTIIIIANDPLIAQKCDQIFMMENGTIIAKDTFSKIIETPKFKEVYYA